MRRLTEREIKFTYVLDYNDPKCCFLSGFEPEGRDEEGDIGATCGGDQGSML
jgi:hypothetical protein